MSRRFQRGGDPHQGTRSGLRAIGGVLAVIGLILLLIGVGSAFAPCDLEGGEFDSCMNRATTGGLMMVFGILMLGVGVGALKWGFMGAAATYAAHETSPALRTGGRAIGRGVTEGIHDGGGLPPRQTPGVSNAPAQAPAQVVKVKCRNCGYLDSEDATYCSDCGEAL